MQQHIHKIFLEVITPTHVGMSQEKAYLKGIDYVYDKGKAIFLNQEKIYKSLNENEIGTFSSLIASGEIGELKDYYKSRGFLKDDFIFPEKTQKIYIPENNDGKINRMYSTGMGQYAIPGSSLKGSIRSILYYHSINNLGKVETEKIFGNINNNPLRHLQVSDCMFSDSNTTAIMPVKVYAADGISGSPYGSWKDGNRNRHNKEFNKENFVSYYETIVPHEIGEVRIIIHEKIRENLKFIETDNIFDLFRKHTAQYLDKELRYFDKFENSNLSNINDEISEIKKHNTQDGCCIIRVGAGVGYHAITGDWKFTDHLIDKIGNNNRGQKKVGKDKEGKDRYDNSAKTRKFTFEPSGNGWNFMPMGYIKLYTEEAWSRNKMDREKEFQDRKLEAEKREQIRLMEIEKKRQLDEVAKKPQYFTGKLKAGAGPIDAVVLKSGIPNMVRLYLKDMENLVEMRGYNNPIPVNTNLQVKINQITAKGEIKQVGYLRFK